MEINLEGRLYNKALNVHCWVIQTGKPFWFIGNIRLRYGKYILNAKPRGFYSDEPDNGWLEILKIQKGKGAEVIFFTNTCNPANMNFTAEGIQIINEIIKLSKEIDQKERKSVDNKFEQVRVLILE